MKPENSPAILVDIKHEERGASIRNMSAGHPGFYSIFVGSDKRGCFCVNPPHSEIIFSRASDMLMSQTYKNVKWKKVEDSENFTEFVSKDRYGKELFGIFIMFAMMLLCVEMVISRKV